MVSGLGACAQRAAERVSELPTMVQLNGRPLPKKSLLNQSIDKMTSVTISRRSCYSTGARVPFAPPAWRSTPLSSFMSKRVAYAFAFTSQRETFPLSCSPTTTGRAPQPTVCRDVTRPFSCLLTQTIRAVTNGYCGVTRPILLSHNDNGMRAIANGLPWHDTSILLSANAHGTSGRVKVLRLC